MKQTMRTLFILLFGGFSSLMQAQETLTLRRCREEALQYNKELRAAARQTEAAHYTAQSYRGYFFPDFTASGTGLYSRAKGTWSSGGGQLPVYSVDASGQATPTASFAYFPGLDLNYKVGTLYVGGVQVEQPIYMGGKITAAYRMAKLGKELAGYQEALTVSEVIEHTDQAFAQVVRAQEMTKVAQRYHELLTELMKNVESAYRHGLKSKNDVLKVQVKLNESELMLRKAENACRLASMNLCHYLGRSLLTSVTVAEGFEELEAEQINTDGNIVNRPEYEMLNRKVAISQQQVKLNRSELLPKVGVQGAYTYVHGLELNDRTLMDNGSFSILLNVNIPLFHFGERVNKVRAAKAQLEQYQLEQQSQNELMELELAQAQNNLEEARLEREIADRSLQQAEENLRVSGKEYEVGLETLSDHLEAQALWQQAYATQVDARYQCYLQGIAYQKASGRLK